ncbi:uncharacterized protein LOC122267686 isoform X2 [Penaeus japonicus]|uniref:uncharacterized protein LOC122267686 isoform X2 n=1 Tax=Penaeus japonicus TaxID=27405 RepID=UPI001C70CFA1|nr:uncharacterized protein LOC122267686 isoform X2 [Penaeus japonicus]
MDNVKEKNEAYSLVHDTHSPTRTATATAGPQFTSFSSGSYDVPNIGSLPSTSKGFPVDVRYNLPWNLHSQSVENNRVGDASVFHSVDPNQYQSYKSQNVLKESFDIPVIDLTQEHTDRYKLDEDQTLTSSERDPHHGQNTPQVKPTCNSTSDEPLGLGQNDVTTMFMWSSETKRPLSTTFLHRPPQSPLFHPSATMITSYREIPRSYLEAQGNHMNTQSPSLSHPSNTQFVQADSALNTPTHFSSPENEADNVTDVEYQRNISPFGILQSSYVNTDEVKKDGGLPGTVADDPTRVTSISQILTREEKEADNVSSVEDQGNISPFGIFQSSYVNTEEVKKDGGPTVTIADYPSRKTSVQQELNSGECDKTQRINNGEEKNDTYPPEFYTDSSSFAVTPVSETQFTNSSSESYNIPNIASVPSTSRGFPGDGEYNLPWNLHSESVDNDHSKSDRPDISVFRSLNPKQYQSNKLQRELKKSFHVPVIDLDQENTDINKLDEDQNLKSLERCPHQSQNIQQVTPSNTTSNGSLGLNHNALTPTLIRSSQAQLPLSTTSLNQSSPSSFFDSAPPVITSSKEMPVTSQGAERSSTNIQSHSPSHPREPQLVPTETSPGKEVESESAAEDQVNTSPSRNSQPSDANSDEISKKDGGLSVPTVDDVPSRERSTKQNLNKKDVLEPIQTKILKYKDGRKRMFMVLHRSSFESMKDKGLIQPVKAFPDGHMLPVTRDEIESSKTLLPPTHQQEDIDKIQYKSITQLEDLETEMPDSLEDIRKLPMPGSCEPASPLQAFERPFSPFEIEWSASSFPGSGEPRGFVPTANQTPIVVTWSATSVTDSPALTFTIRLPSKMNASPFTLHSASVIPSGASNQSASTPKTMIRPKLSTETPHTSLWPPASFSNQAPSSAAQDPSQMHDMSPAKELDQDANHDVPKEPKVLNISNNRGSKNQKPVRKNIFWLANKQGHSELMEEEVKQLAENARNHYKNFEETKLEMKKRYNRLLNKHSQRYNGLLKKYKNLERTCNVTKDAGSREQIIRDAKKFLSEDHAMFLESQMFLKNRAGKGNRFSKKFLKYVIGIYEQSPAGYKFLRTIFTLPSIRTIHKWQSRSYQNVEENLVDQDLTEMTGTYGDIESFADMLQMEPLPSGHEQTEMNNTESFQELTSVPPTDFYESNGALFWEGSQVCFEVPHDIAVPQEQPVQRGCEVEYIQTAEDMYMLSQ